jgi:hypothetical protein
LLLLKKQEELLGKIENLNREFLLSSEKLEGKEREIQDLHKVLGSKDRYVSTLLRF